MKYTKTAIRELNAKYRAVLKKMFLINAAVLLTFSINASANATVVPISDGQAFENLKNNNKDNQNAAGLTLSNETYTLSQDGANNVKFINNSSVNSGGAMKALNGFTAGDNWEFDGNHSDKISGGLYVKIPNSGSENRNVTFGDGTTFSNNTSKWLGGALGIEAADTVTLGDNATFDTNDSKADGGAIAVWTDGTNTNVTTGTTLNLGKTTFTNNTATNRGGALANLNNDTTPTAHFNTVNIGAGSTFTDNSAKMGGAIYNIGTMNISETTFSQNKATGSGYGGAIFNSKGILTINDSTFTDNEATWDGAAISSATSYLKDKTPEETRAYWQSVNGFDAANKLIINNSTFDNNKVASYSGGAMGIYSDATITNSIFTNNNAGGNNPSTTVDGGGAIYVGGWGRVDIDGTTFEKNSSNIGGAIATTRAGLVDDAYVTIKNSTFTGNTATEKGGAIASKFTTNISDTTFDGNSASTGGALFAEGNLDYQSESDIAVVTIDNTKFINNSISGANVGGAVTAGRNSKIIITNSIFDSNKAENGWAGAIYAYTPTTKLGKSLGGYLDISDTSFINNEALSTGAVGIFSQASLKNVSFDGNKATDASDDGAGAIFLGAQSQTTIDGATFTKNTSAAAGGAIATRDNAQGSQADATLDLSNATFVENTAGTKGGAIFNTLYNDAANSGFASLSTVSFDKNSAKLGGAIYNDGTGDKVVSGKNQGFASMHITDGTFTNNTASENGGAIYNSGQGVINLSGTNTFTGNTAAGVANDIYNDGTLNISGSLVLDGGITGNGTVNFDNGTSLKTALLADASSSAIVKANKITGNDINLVIENGSNGGQVKFEAAENTLTIANNNALYNIEGDDTGLFNVTKKSSSELAETLGAKENQAAAVLAVTNGTCDNAEFNAISEAVNTLVQSSDPNAVATGVKAAATLAPATIHVPTAHTTQNVNQIFSAVSSRLSSGSISSMGGQSSGDEILGNGAVWAKALYNKSKLSTQDGFDAYSRGLAIGAEGHVHDQVKIGVAYAYTNSDIKPDDRKSEIDSNSAVLYAEYKPNNWFLNGIASYTWGRYDEHKYVLGTDVKAKYDVNSFSAQVQTGYDFYVRNYTLTPEIGLRYMNIDQKGFTDTIGNYTNANKSDVFTGVIGATAKAAYAVNGNVMLKPELRIAATYDFVNDDVASVMTLANGSVISTQGEALKKFGTEVGFGLTAVVADNVELGIGYEGKFRKHYSDNTGMITAKYNF